MSISDNRRPKDEKDAQPELIGQVSHMPPFAKGLVTFSPITWYRNGDGSNILISGENALSRGVVFHRDNQ